MLQRFQCSRPCMASKLSFRVMLLKNSFERKLKRFLETRKFFVIFKIMCDRDFRRATYTSITFESFQTSTLFLVFTLFSYAILKTSSFICSNNVQRVLYSSYIMAKIPALCFVWYHIAATFKSKLGFIPSIVSLKFLNSARKRRWRGLA